ncbi:MAG: type I toxin-antitoxin system SymE family toxin [Candidatus Thiodiazotropha sp. (ex Epidulcina cf. delphinae)]|nr:type I toxin-antitoxin system SymE family toxin [Candidatus Thiodiazotropha sp. (ex Epidulcina cf. delphinae)]
MAKQHGKPGNRPRKNKICEQRYIKVNAIHYEYRTKQQSSHSASRAVPWIQMKGHWLDQAGFSIDTPVTVRVMEGCLVLTVENRPTIP